MKSSNPVLTRGGAFHRVATVPAAYGPGYAEPSYAPPYDTTVRAGRMTVEDVVMKTGLLLGILVAVGAATWVLTEPGAAMGFAGLAALAGFALAMVNIFKRQVSPPLVVAYAVCEGVFLGAISQVFETAYSGIVFQAVVATVAIFAGVLAAYRSGLIKATPMFRKVVIGGLFGLVGLVVINSLVAMFSGGDALGLNGENFGLSVLVALGLIGFGAMSFVLDFDQVEALERAGVEERESWRAAFGLIVGLVFLYLQILRLLAILRGDD